MKKGFMNYVPLVLGFVILAIVAVLGLSVLSSMSDTFVASSIEANATDNAVEGLVSVTDFMPLIGIVLAIVIVLGILLNSLMSGKVGGAI
jgi:type II secretory pathway component PulF